MRDARTSLLRTLVLAGGIVSGAACADSTSPSHPVVDLIDCPPTTSGGDVLSRGLYVDSFPGSSLRTVTSYFSAVGTGDRTVALTARDGAFDGAVIGTDTVTFGAVDGDSSVAVTFDLGGKSVTTGSTVTFSYGSIADSAGTVFQQTTTSNAACPVTETNGTTPALDTDRRVGMALKIRGTH